MKRPCFFISSTIYDFRDLRSSIKYFLEQQGCTVLASECNDFPKQLEMHTYEACLKTLEHADYFILLIGSRVGGWYDKENKISITQQEYRAAYQRHLKGKLKIISFVRNDVWQYREDRNELSRFLEKQAIDPGAKHDIVNHPSKWANDSEFICRFISEVCKNEETKKALKDPSQQMPSGNWIHVYNNFRDVIDVIQAQVFSGIPIEQVMFRRLLLREIVEVIRTSLVKFKEGHVYSPEVCVENFYKEHELNIESRDKEYFAVKARRWDILASLAVGLMGVKYNTLILQRALESPAFQMFDLETSTYKEHPVYGALYQLNEQINLFNRENTTKVRSVMFRHSPRDRDPDSETVYVNTMQLLAFLYLFDRWINVINLSRAIVVHLQGEPFKMPKLRPISPIPEMNDELAEERVSKADVDAFIHENS